jgi:formate hydrogenlyase transcriptional activator
LFQTYDWPGNIRELQDVIERGVLLCDSDSFAVDEAWFKMDSPKVTRSSGALASDLDSHEKEMIEAALAGCKGRIAGPHGAAVKLGLARQTLDSKIASLKIDKHRFKSL